MRVVKVSLVFIVKDVVGFLDGLELDFGGFTFFFGDFVGVTGKSGLTVRSFSFILRCVLGFA